MLKAAFNALTRIHSRAATIKRLGTPDIYSPLRVSPSNYFRFLQGPEYTTIKGIEFVIPKDSLKGHFSQSLVFSAVPDFGVYKITLGAESTANINFDANAAAVQAAIRLLPSYAYSVVTGLYTTGFNISFEGKSSAPTLGVLTDNTLTRLGVAVTATFTNTYTAWAKPISKGDRITDGTSQWSVDEIMNMHDLGASVIGYRCRCD